MSARILFFDSGMGGITVYDEVRKILPDQQYLYVFDNQYFPYSEKDEQTIIDRVVKICSKIDSLYKLDLIVIACNTASTIVLPKLREIFSIPIVGTVPAVKPATIQKKHDTIGILATVGTIKREYLQNLIDNFVENSQVLKLGSTELVNLAEKKFYGDAIEFSEIRQALDPWLNKEIDVIVLGCTHFPLIKQELQEIFPNTILLDSGQAIAKRVQFLLQDKEISSILDKQPNLLFATKPVNNELQLLKALDTYDFQELTVIEV